jgi:hypothetical protein
MIFKSEAKKLLGQKVAVLAARYQYRGILSDVGDDCLVLADATVVEVSGPASGDTPQTEDPIHGFVIIKNDAIEILHQAKFSQAPLPGEE